MARIVRGAGGGWKRKGHDEMMVDRGKWRILGADGMEYLWATDRHFISSTPYVLWRQEIESHYTIVLH